MNIIRFPVNPRPRVIIDFCTVKQSDEFPPGSAVFVLEYRERGVAETLWIGTSYQDALKAARAWQDQGVRLVDKTGGANA
ncbi:MAG: hypothetical protein WA733_12490 [Methylocystis sp.]